MSSPQIITHTFQIPALDCPEEYVLIDKGLAQLAGVRRTIPDYFGRSLRVEFDPATVQIEAMEEQLRRIGFSPSPKTSPSSRSDIALPTTPLRWTTLLGGSLIIAGAALYWLDYPQHWLAFVLVLATASSGWHVARAAWRALRLRAVEMNVLMTIAAVGAMATGEFFEAATAMFLFSVSLWLESYTLDRARHAVKSLLQVAPPIAHRIVIHHSPHDHHDHHELSEKPSTMPDPEGHRHILDIDPRTIAVGDLLLIRPGERIPVDGAIAQGTSAVDESPITGESLPVEKAVGDWLFAGSLNGEGTLELMARTTANDSTLAQVARLIERAQEARSPTERFIDRFARYYTPVVVSIGLLVAFAPALLAQLGVVWFATVPFTEWLHRGLVLLVIACPCALVISTPITIICGLHQATRFGLLIKGGEYLEVAGRLNCVAFDKTGTLTEGHPRLADVRSMPGFAESEVLQVAASLESASEHPLGVAIVTAARDRGIAMMTARNVTTTRGAGVAGEVAGQRCYVGSVAHALTQSHLTQLPPTFAHAPADMTIAVVGRGKEILGALYLADRPRSDARQTISELRRMHVPHLVMLTGDRHETAGRIAIELGIDLVHAELLPQDKVRIVAELVREHEAVAMVGDGVNDAPALAAAHLGIALGTQASHTALETADVVSLSPHLRQLPALIQLGRDTRRILSQNIALALSIKLAVLCLAAAGLGTLWAAVAADVGASMLVIVNGMRLLRPVVIGRAQTDPLTHPTT